MKSLTAENFKAFRKQLELNCPNDENVLIYGENGSGKSSLYDAFKLFYFKDEIFAERIQANVVEGRADEENAVISSFAFDKTNDPMTLSIDGVDYMSYNPLSDAQVFLLSYKDLIPLSESEDCICIRSMIERLYLKYENAIANWYDADAELEIVTRVNRTLVDDFYINDLELSVSQTGDEVCLLKLKDRVKQKRDHLSRYFNEATLHLVRFIVLMESISFVRNKQKPALLVLDDCFNSLDAPNRTFMMRYLFRETKGMQKIIMTHNLSFFNLMSHILNTEHREENWVKYILCMIDGNFDLQDENKASDVDDVVAKRNAGYYTDSTQLGNAIRQVFEVLVYRLTMLCNIGVMQESSHLLELMCNPSCNVYLSMNDNHDVITASDLVDEIYKSVTNGNYYKLDERLRKKIDAFRANDILTPLRPALVELRLLQKVALHQSSHGHMGLPPVQSKEFDVCIALLKKIESAIKSIHTVDVSSI